MTSLQLTFEQFVYLQVTESTKAAPNVEEMDGLAGALARALAERSKAIHPDSSSSEEEEFDDDEWE